jgi:hypothetical protein
MSLKYIKIYYISGYMFRILLENEGKRTAGNANQYIQIHFDSSALNFLLSRKSRRIGLLSAQKI